MVSTKHCVIIAIDICIFSQKTRKDSDRMKLRDLLSEFLNKSLEVCTIEDHQIHRNETGDGIIYAIEGESPEKYETILIPRLKEMIEDNNRRSSDVLKIQIRCVLHRGDVFFDQDTLSEEGFSGKEITKACRILDNDNLRKVAKDNPYEEVILGLTDTYFYQLAEILPAKESKYSKHCWKTKDDSEAVFLPKNICQSVDIVKKGISDTKTMKLNDVSGVCIFLPIFDYHNMDLYYRKSQIKPLRQHLETAIMVGDHVLVHCVDPYRSMEVYNLLKDYEEFIQDGTIIFLLGRQIQDIERDYYRYIEGKMKQYESTSFGKHDIESLDKKILGLKENQIKDVVDLLKLSPYCIHRGFQGTDSFRKSVQKDLEPIERIFISTSSLQHSKLNRTNLTIYQLLTLSTKNDDGRIFPFIEEKVSREIVNVVLNAIDNKDFSRNIVLSIINSKLQKEREPFDGFFDRIEERLCLLHSRINYGSMHFSLEYTRDRDKNSPLYYEEIYNHLSSIDGDSDIEYLGSSRLRELRKTSSWNNFLSEHLSIMAMIHARRIDDYDIEPEELYSKKVMQKDHLDIQQILTK